MDTNTTLSAGTLMGDRFRNPGGDDLGTLEEIVLDLDRGRIAYAVLASGGFLGLGDRYFAIPWDMISVDTEEKELVVDLDRDRLEDAPGFDKDNWPDMSDRTWMADVYRHYDRVPHWERD